MHVLLGLMPKLNPVVLYEASIMDTHPLENKIVKYCKSLESAGLWAFIALYGILVKNEGIGMIISFITAISAIMLYTKWIMDK